MQPPSPTILLDRKGHAYLLLPGPRRLKAISEQRRRSLWNMNDTVERLGRVGGEVLGYWRWALVSPDGATLLAQWSGECEIPAAFFLRNGEASIVTGETSLSKAPKASDGLLMGAR